MVAIHFSRRIMIEIFLSISLFVMLHITSQELENNHTQKVFIDAPEPYIILVNFHFVAVTPAMIELAEDDLITLMFSGINCFFDGITDGPFCFHHLYSNEKSFFIKRDGKYYFINGNIAGLRISCLEDMESIASDKMSYVEITMPSPSESLLEKVTKAFSSLKILKIHNVMNDLLSYTSIQKVEILDISNSFNINDAGLFHLQKFSNLRGLTLSYCPGVTSDGLKYIDKLLHLSFLDLGMIYTEDKGLFYLENLKYLTAINLRNNPITNKGLSYLKPFHNLQFLHLRATKITDDGLLFLAHFKKMRVLNLEATKITNKGLYHLKNLKNLHSLNLGYNWRINDEGTVYLKDLQSLSSLNLWYTDIKNEGLKNLKNLKNLDELILSETDIDNLGLSNLPYLSNLSKLSLDSTRITDSGLANIASLQNLQWLDLSRTDISNACLLHLNKLKNLHTLIFYKPRLVNRPRTVNGPVITDIGFVSLNLQNFSMPNKIYDLASLKDMPNLHTLSLAYTEVTNDGLMYLNYVPNLCRLSLAGTKITDEGLIYLKNVPNLHTLSLAQTNISNKGLAYLKNHLNLYAIDLSYTKIDSGVLEHITKMKNLCWLNLNQTKVDEKTMIELKMAFPTCNIGK